MKDRLVYLAARLRKSLGAPTVHAMVPRLLLSVLVAELRRRLPDAAAVNRELHRYGFWMGDRFMAVMAKKSDLELVFPRDGRPRGMADGMRVYGAVAWYLFAGHFPEMEVRVVELEGGSAVSGVIRVEEGRDYIFTRVLSVEGVNPFYVASGAYEAATMLAFRMLELEDRWWTLWRPLGRGGIAGYYVERGVPVEELAAYAEEEHPGFFGDVPVEVTLRLFKEYLGVEVR